MEEIRKKKKKKVEAAVSLKGPWALASTCFTCVHGMNRTESQCVPPYGRSDFKVTQIFFFSLRGAVYYRAKSKTEFQHSGI